MFAKLQLWPTHTAGEHMNDIVVGSWSHSSESDHPMKQVEHPVTEGALTGNKTKLSTEV